GQKAGVAGRADQAGGGHYLTWRNSSSPVAMAAAKVYSLETEAAAQQQRGRSRRRRGGRADRLPPPAPKSCPSFVGATSPSPDLRTHAETFCAVGNL
ncbi:unnamed protein product, partial [Urochloa humidicola]